MYVYYVSSVCLHVRVGVCVCVGACMCGSVHSSGGCLPADLPVELGSEEKQGWREGGGCQQGWTIGKQTALWCQLSCETHIYEVEKVTFHLWQREPWAPAGKKSVVWALKMNKELSERGKTVRGVWPLEEHAGLPFSRQGPSKGQRASGPPGGGRRQVIEALSSHPAPSIHCLWDLGQSSHISGPHFPPMWGEGRPCREAGRMTRVIMHVSVACGPAVQSASSKHFSQSHGVLTSLRGSSRSRMRQRKPGPRKQGQEVN